MREGQAAGLEFSVTRDKDRLYVDFAGQERTELIPRGGASFVCISLSARAELEFVLDGDGLCAEVGFRQGDLEARAFRLDSRGSRPRREVLGSSGDAHSASHGHSSPGGA